MILLIFLINFFMSWIMLVLIKEEKIAWHTLLLKWLNWLQISVLALFSIITLCLMCDWYFCAFLKHFGRGQAICMAFIYAIIGFIVFIFNLIAVIQGRRSK